MDVEHVKQPSPVSERSAVWLGVTPWRTSRKLEVIEMVMAWSNP